MKSTTINSKIPFVRWSMLMAAILGLSAAKPASGAVIIASDLTSNPDNASTETAGYWEADSFVTDGNSYLLTAALAYVRLDSGPTNFAFGLYADNAGVPGTLLDTLTPETPLTAVYQYATFTPTSANILLPNTTYWLGARVTTGGVEWAWNTGSGIIQSGVGTVTGFFVGTYDQGASWLQGGLSPNLFQIEGTVVPEPSACTMLGLGLSAVVARRRRQA